MGPTTAMDLNRAVTLALVELRAGRPHTARELLNTARAAAADNAYVIAAWDGPERTFRHEADETYKATRAAMPDDLRRAHEENDEVLERIYIGRRFRNDTERLETLFDMYTKMIASPTAPKKREIAALRYGPLN